MKIFDRLVYALTKKPQHYVHVDNPKTLQDLRQEQYNKWCKAKGVYNGAYLPLNPNTLTRKGWEETKGKKDKTVRNFKRKSSGQRVRFDVEVGAKRSHYHWENGKTVDERRKILPSEKYLDRYGKPCSKKEDRHHLAPLDRDWHGGTKKERK